MVGQKAGVQAISVFFYPRSARFRVAWQVIWKAGASDWQTTSHASRDQATNWIRIEYNDLVSQVSDLRTRFKV
jgi:hypothetical protein